MTSRLYDIFLEDKLIGTTELEKADVPMGVVFGEITFANISWDYDFLKKYCLVNNIEITTDHPNLKLIATANIPNLKVVSPNGIEIKGQGTSINGMDTDIFEITIWAVPYPFFQEEFKLHVKAYKDQLKES